MFEIRFRDVPQSLPPPEQAFGVKVGANLVLVPMRCGDEIGRALDVLEQDRPASREDQTIVPSAPSGTSA